MKLTNLQFKPSRAMSHAFMRTSLFLCALLPLGSPAQQVAEPKKDPFASACFKPCEEKEFLEAEKRLQGSRVYGMKDVLALDPKIELKPTGGQTRGIALMNWKNHFKNEFFIRVLVYGEQKKLIATKYFKYIPESGRSNKHGYLLIVQEQTVISSVDITMAVPDAPVKGFLSFSCSSIYWGG